jgi:hypothetical protein
MTRLLWWTDDDGSGRGQQLSCEKGISKLLRQLKEVKVDLDVIKFE